MATPNHADVLCQCSLLNERLSISPAGDMEGLLLQDMQEKVTARTENRTTYGNAFATAETKSWSRLPHSKMETQNRVDA